MKPKQLDFWYEFGSNYSYLSAMRIEALARQAGVSVNWKPFLLGPIFRELGWESSPFLAQKEKLAYVWRDLERRSKKYGLPFKQPSQFPRIGLLPARVAIQGMNQPWIAEFSRRIMLENWAHDREINDAEVVREALLGLVPQPDELLQAAQGESAKANLRIQTAAARSLGIFGAPSFFVGDDMFWGDDRLEDAIDASLR
jgi:2-hydroxychromene-2-carboxylate isomerase